MTEFIEHYGPLVGFWGGVIGILGGVLALVIGWLVIEQRFFPPGLDVLEAVPVAVEGRYKLNEQTARAYGVSVIVHVQSRGREVMLTGIEAEGDISLSFNEFLGVINADKRNIQDIGKEYEEKKPYFRILWSGWLEEANALRLAPHEDIYVRFTFLAPSLNSARYEFGDDYVGFRGGGRAPSRSRYHPSWNDIFTPKISSDKRSIRPSALRDEFREGGVKLSIRAGGGRVRIKSDQLQGLKVISESDWKSKPPEQLFTEPWTRSNPQLP